MNFQFLKERSLVLGLSLHVVACEALQALFLDRFYAHKEADTIYFHGGTSLRLLHGGYRFSEDLDFACPRYSETVLKRLVGTVSREFERLLIQHWGPAKVELKGIHENFPVLSWWLNASHPEYRGKFKVKIEIGRFPVHTPQVFPLQPTDGYFGLRPLVSSQSLKESFADKINAIAQRPFVKGRDLFDLWFLKEVLNTQLDPDLIRQKFKDYKTKNPKQALLKVSEVIPRYDLALEMNRFLPRSYRTKLSAHHYQAVKDATLACLQEVIRAWGWR